MLRKGLLFISTGILLALTLPAAAAPLWEEDALIGLPSGDFNDSLMDTYTLFDRDGTQVGTTVGRCDVGQFWGYLPEGVLHRYVLDKEWFIQNTQNLETLLHYREGECVSWVGTKYYCVYRFEDHTVEVCDKNGELLEQRHPSVFADADASGPEQLVMLGTESEAGLLIHIRRRTDQGSEHLYSFLRKDDGTWADTEDPDFPEILTKECEHTLGKYYLFYDSETSLYDLYTDQGILIMNDLSCSYSMDRFDPMRIVQTDSSPSEVRYVILTDESTGEGRVFDTLLEEQGRIDGIQLNTWGDWAVGLPCEDLGGKICTAFYPYCSRSQVPGAYENGVYYLSIGGRDVSFSLPEGEKLVSLNERYVQTGLSDEGGNTTGYRLYSLEDLENGIFNVKMDDLTSEMELCSGSCLLSGFGYPRTESTIYDGNLTPVLTTKGWVRPALDGTYYLRRGPWHGFIDGNGNWLIRENYADE